MKAVVKTKEEVGFEYKPNYPRVAPVGDECQVKIKAVAICGSDINVWKWNETAKNLCPGRQYLPFILGHEAAGEVVSVGENATLKVGQKVGVENHFFCSDCSLCEEGRGDVCIRMSQFGYGKGTDQGGMCEYANVPSRYLYPVNSDISFEQICLMEPLGVAHNIIERMDVKDKNILVIGCGPVGLLAVAVARALGARHITAVDMFEHKLNIARTLGATDSIDAAKSDLQDEVMRITNGNGFDRICEASGHGPTLEKAFQLLKKGGKLGIVGIPKTEITIQNPLPDLVFKSLEIHTVHGRRIFHTWREVEQLIASKKITPELVISHRFPLSKFEEAFDLLMKGKACKIVFNPTL